jgi:CheY-like chemotaxis protein
LKLLLVDDEPMVLTVGRRVLEPAGHEVLVAETGREALKICEDAAQHLDLVISDVLMPGMTGIELADCLQKRQKPVPLILMSGHLQTSQHIRKLLGGRNAVYKFLQKPFLPKDLLKLVGEFDVGATSPL